MSKSIKHCAFAVRECLSTLTADVTLLLTTVDTDIANVDTDIAMTQFSSCGTVWIVAEYFTGIHLLTPFVFAFLSFLKGCQWIPFFVNPFLHTLLWCYQITRVGEKMSVSNYLYKIVGDCSPTLLLEKTNGNQFFERYKTHFENIWRSGKVEVCDFDGETGKLRWVSPQVMECRG